MFIGTVIKVIVPALLCLWILGTIMVPIDEWTESDYIPTIPEKYMFFIPRWNFFAPHPGQWDYHLLYRDKFSDGSMTQWTETVDVSNTRQSHKLFWNPNLYKAKSLFDICLSLSKRVVDNSVKNNNTESTGDTILDHKVELEDMSEYLSSPEYLLLLNHISGKTHEFGATETQFMLMRSSLRRDATPVFISNFHEL